MRALDPTLALRIKDTGTTLARLITFELLNGTVLRFTDSDADITYGGHLYVCKYGCTVSQIQIVLGTSTQSCTVETIIASDGVSTELIESGALDDARFTVLAVDFDMPTLAAVIFYVGFVSKVDYKDRLTASIQGMPLLARGQPIATEKYSSNCRVDFGDARCKKDLDPLKVEGVNVTLIGNFQKFMTDDTTADGFWNNGLAVFSSGLNDGFSFEIASNTHAGVIVLKAVVPFPVAVGDTLTLYPGCDKTIANCKFWDNIVNFRGEPFSIAPYVGSAAVTTQTTTIVNDAPAAPSAAATPASTPSPAPAVLYPLPWHLIDGGSV